MRIDVTKAARTLALISVNGNKEDFQVVMEAILIGWFAQEFAAGVVAGEVGVLGKECCGKCEVEVKA